MKTFASLCKHSALLILLVLVPVIMSSCSNESVPSTDNPSGSADNSISSPLTDVSDLSDAPLYPLEELNSIRDIFNVSYKLDKSILPVLYITTEAKIGEQYCEGNMLLDASYIQAVDNPDTIAAGSAAACPEYYGGVSIKLRGNSTKWREKHPYKIKLEAKSDLLGMGSNKHWVLLANDIDHTNIRNKITLDFALALGMNTSSESRLVSLFINGEYRGIYQLTEQIRVGKSRVNIYDWGDTFGDTKPLKASEIDTDVPQTGGFLLEADFYAFSDPNAAKVITKFSQPFYFNTPEYIGKDTGLYKYAYNYIQSFEYALHSPDHIYHANDRHYTAKGLFYDWSNAKAWVAEYSETDYSDPTFDGCHYTELFDLDSLINNLLVCETAVNWDSMKNSVFLYKDIDGPAYMGPVWDFDWAYGNINMYNINTNMPEGWQTTNEYFTNEQFYQSVQWNRYLVSDPYFLLKLYNRYHEIRYNQLADLYSSVDNYINALEYDGHLNEKRWKYTWNARNYSGGRPENFANSMKSLKSFLDTRIAWLDAQFSDIDTLISSFGRYKPTRYLFPAIDSDGNLTVTLSGSSSVINAETIGSLRLQINGTGLIDITLKEAQEGYKLPTELLNKNYGTNMIQIYPLTIDGEYFLSGEPDSPAESAYIVY